MIGATLKRLFTKPKSKESDLRPDTANASEITHCPICQSNQIKKTVWRTQGFKSRTPVRMAAERYGLGIEVEYDCPCGFHHKGSLFR